MKETRDRLRAGLEEKVGDIRFNGHPERCLPNTLSVSFRNIDAGTLLSHMKGSPHLPEQPATGRRSRYLPFSKR